MTTLSTEAFVTQYREEGLSLRRKTPRRRSSAVRRAARPLPNDSNESWSMYFVSDQLYNGQPILVLTIVDNYNRESLALKVGRRLRGADVVAVLNELICERGRPKKLWFDLRPEYWINGHTSTRCSWITADLVHQRIITNKHVLHNYIEISIDILFI